MKRALYTAAAISAVVLGGAAACDDASGPESERVSVALAVPQAGGFSAGDVSVTSSSDDDPLIIVRGRQRLRLDLVELNIDRVALRAIDLDDDEDTDVDTDTDHDTDTESDSDTDTDAVDIITFRDDVTVRLPLQGGVIAPFSGTVPVGSYDRVSFWVETAHIVGAYDSDFDGVFEGDENCGVGENDCGEFFNEVVRVRQRFTLRIRPPLVVEEGEGQNVTIVLEPDWFRNPDRSLFNPRRLKNEHQLRARFRHLIAATLRAFKDANRNGVDDRDTDH